MDTSVAAYVGNTRLMKYVWGHVVFLGISVLVVCVVYVWFPTSYRDPFLVEDHLIENLSAVFFLGACVLGFLFFMKTKAHRKIFLLFSAVGLLGFLDELSFGERMFRLSMPRIGGTQIDAAHDFVYLGFGYCKNFARSHPAYTLLLIGIGAILMVRATFLYRSRLMDSISSLQRYPQYILMLICVTLVSCALLIDLEMVSSDLLFMLEEVFEMNAAIALLLCCLSVYDQRAFQKPPTKSN